MPDNLKSKWKFEAANLLYLVEKYGIDPREEDAWLNLALSLARDKVKGFSDAEILPPQKVGRPKKKISLAKIMTLGEPKRRRGAPTKMKFNPEWVDEFKAKYGLSGRGSDKKAIEIMVAEYRALKDRKREVAYVQKRLSESRKIIRSFQKIPIN